MLGFGQALKRDTPDDTPALAADPRDFVFTVIYSLRPPHAL